MKLYMGCDQREGAATDAAIASLRHHSPQIELTRLELDKLTASGLMSRPMDRRGSIYDIVSGANCSTEFAASRFLTPILAQHGWALFTDCDVIFLDDIESILDAADPAYAVMVVKHKQEAGSGIKMDCQVQSFYPRKNWSSVMLFNCDHPANQRLTLRDVNERPGRDLHAFYWLNDAEIGELPAQWNWLVGVQSKPDDVKIAHFTLGGPWLPNWAGSRWDQLWFSGGKADG